ncbi:MAG: cupin domain-containing protein [Bacteroidetes bacterium]|nr:cupin domain-containing protein [Bacteroidota bacterium]
MVILYIIGGILILPVIYNLLFPLKKPELNNYFKAGQTYTSTGEGITQKILRQEGNKVFCELTLAPHAAGPPEHMHEHMHETISVVSGTLNYKLNGKEEQVGAGGRINFPAGAYHKMWNTTNNEVVLRSEKPEDFVPVEFVYSLDQLYPLMQSNGLTLKMFAKICVLDELFDSVPAGPPPVFFRIIKKVVKPYARIFGVKP